MKKLKKIEEIELIVNQLKQSQTDAEALSILEKITSDITNKVEAEKQL